MISRSRIITSLGVCLVAAAGGCGSSTGPDSGDQVEITLAVSGGFAGMDWQYTVDGRTGRIVGDRCRGPVGCDWTSGEELAAFDPADLEPLADEFFVRDFFDGPSDYGTECCDQLDYVLTYRDSDDERSVRGSDGTIPQNILSLILILEQFVANARG